MVIENILLCNLQHHTRALQAPAGAGECGLQDFPGAASRVRDVACWDCSLLESLKTKCRKRKARKHPREPQRHCQSESSKEPGACCSVNSGTCQVQLWSVWSLQIKEQGSACYTLTVCKLKKTEPGLYKKNFYLPRFGKIFHLALLLAREGWGVGEHSLPAEPTDQDRAVKCSSFIRGAQQGQAGFASSLWTGISISRAVNTAPFRDSEVSSEIGR